MERLILDNIELGDRGIWLGSGSYKSLLGWPALKPVPTNDWAEYNGVEVDLSAPALAARKVALTFVCTGEAGYEQLIDELRRNSLHRFEFPELGIDLRMRMDENSIKGLSSRVQGVTITFVDDEPYDGSSLALFELPDLWKRSGVLLDGVDLGILGVSVLKDTYKSIRSIPKIRQRLAMAIETGDGQVYDWEGAPLTTAGDMTLKLLIRQPTARGCLTAYYTLLRSITQPGEHSIYVEEWEDEYVCYYKSETVQNVCQFLASGLWGIAFDITMTTIDRPSSLGLYLTNDGGDIKLTNTRNQYLTK